MLTKLAVTLRTFAEQRPSLRELSRGRRRQFDAVDCILPSRVTTGESLSATVTVWDEYLRLLEEFEGEFAVSSTDPDATHPDRVRFDAADEPTTGVDGVTFETPGVQYLVLEPTDGAAVDETGGARFVSNPVQVFAEEPAYRLYWGDIHLHSQFSDGAGRMSRGFRFGRDVMDLDVAAYTDHDTMGFFIPPSLQRRRMHGSYFDRMRAITDEFNDPESFVTLFGYEWTKQPNVGGHVNVYFEDPDDAELFDSMDPETNRYEKLWRRLQEWREDHDSDVLTIPHHPAEQMYPFDFSAVDYDDDMAPLVEVYSQWGSSERPGSEGNPKPISMGHGEMDLAGHYVQDAHQLGHRVGMMASSDFHAPRPGRSNIHLPAHLPSLSDVRRDGVGWGHIWRVWNEGSHAGGLTGFYAPELTREAIFESLRSRRVYGTSQPHRIVVEFAVDGTAVGENDSTVVLDAPDAERTVSLLVAGTAPLARVTVVKNNDDWHTVEGTTDEDAPHSAFVVEREVTDGAPVTGMRWDADEDRTDADRSTDADVYYCRVEQADGGITWAGPIWVETGE